MKRVKISKVILFVTTVLLLLSISLNVKADDSLVLLTPTNDAANNTTNSNTNNTVNNMSNSDIVQSPINTSNKTNTSAYINNSNSNLPKTGAEDYTTVFIIAGVCIVSAIYAYKKANNYNGVK